MHPIERRAPLWAASFILVLAIWGMLIGEPYWRAVGHGPTAFQWTSWTAILLSAPASLLARPAARIMTTDFELEFMLEHIFWAVFVILQWAVVRRAVARVRPARQWTFAVAAVLSGMSVMAGVVWWTMRWPLVHGGEGVSWNVLNQPIGVFGLALVPPAWLLVQRRHHGARTDLETPRRDRRWRLWAAGFAGTLLLMGLLAFPTARPGSWVFALKYQDEFRQSEVAIQAVEAFRRAHGRLPDSLQEAGLPLERFDERCPCYDKKGEQSYYGLVRLGAR
jgi:hypothetical protein